MNNHHKKILEQIYSFPALGEIKWPDMESLFLSLGAKIREGKGSGVSFIYDSTVANFHRPHPGNELKPYQAKDAKKFLENIGATLESPDL